MTARKFVIKILKYNDIQHNDNETNNDNINQDKSILTTIIKIIMTMK